MKKRFIAFFILLILITFPAAAEEEGAVDSDFSTMTTAQLYTALDEINVELASRGEHTELYEGSYCVGTDIPSGRYAIEGIDEEYRSAVWSVTIWNSSNAEEEYNKAYSEWETNYALAVANENAGNEYVYPKKVIKSDYYTQDTVYVGETLYVTLTDNEVLSIEREGFSSKGELIIKKMTPLFSD